MTMLGFADAHSGRLVLFTNHAAVGIGANVQALLVAMCMYFISRS